MDKKELAFPLWQKIVHPDGSWELIQQEGLTKFEHLVVEYTKAILSQPEGLKMSSEAVTGKAIAMAESTIQLVTKYNNSLKDSK